MKTLSPQFAECLPHGGVFRDVYVVVLERNVDHKSEEPTYLREVEGNGSDRKALWLDIRDSSNGERRTELYDAPVPKTRVERERFLNRYVPMIYRP